MALVPWQPFQEIETLQREMNQLFDRLMPSDQINSLSTAFVPPAEMQETADAIQLRLEVPGLAPEDLDIQATQDTITISGERRSQSKQEGNGSVRSEFRYGKFQRVLSLPVPIQPQQVKAEYGDGILNLTLPKAEEAKATPVQIKASRADDAALTGAAA